MLRLIAISFSARRLSKLCLKMRMSISLRIPSKKAAISNQDNMLLHDILEKIFSKTGVWTHAKCMSKDHDGRRAMRLMKTKQLGTHATEVRYNKAHESIRSYTYCGEKQRLNWAKYVLSHKKIHEKFDDLTEWNYNDLTPREKFQPILKGVKCNDLDATISIISSSD